MSAEDASARQAGPRAAIKRFWTAARPDVLRAAGFFFCAFFMGVVYVNTWGGLPEFWQPVFAPSVMTACGHGFTNPHMDEVPALEDFLYLRAERFDCAEIPDDVTLLPEDTSGMTYDEIQAFHPLGQFPGWTQWQRFHRYLLLSVALMFYLFGVAWPSLTPLYGLLYGLTNALGYGVFRLAMGRHMATLCGVVLMTSPVHLQQLPQLRDYSKAPFFFLIILVVGWLLKRERPLRHGVPLAALAGFFAGLGLGFRQDVSIAAGVFCLLVALFWPGTLKHTWWRRAAVVVAFLAAGAILGAPIVQVLMRVNNSTHDTIIGFMRYCDQRLGVEAPLYDFGDPFKDEYVRGILMGYAYRTEGRTEVFRHYSPPYDAAGKAYFREMATTFPADLLVRGYASVLRTVDELQSSNWNRAPRGITNQFVARLYQWRERAIDTLPGVGRYHVAAALLVLAAYRLRLGFAAFTALMILAGYPALRFSARHAFHMEFISVLATGFLLYWAFWAAVMAWRHRRTVAWRPVLAATRIHGSRAAAFAIVISLVLVLPLQAARWWQTRQVAPLLSAYESADRTLLVQDIEQRNDGTALVRVPGLTEAARRDDDALHLPMYTEVLVLACLPAEVPLEIAFEFEADHPNFQFDRSMVIPAAATAGTEPVQLYYPVYFGNEARFQGYSLPASALDQVQAAYRLTDIDDFRILPNAVLPADWRAQRLYQTFSR